jgi:hypothetical protein
MDLINSDAEDHYTLLAVRADGVAPVVDLVMADALELVTRRARALLQEHASCATVEVWRGGDMLEKISRA